MAQGGQFRRNLHFNNERHIEDLILSLRKKGYITSLCTTKSGGNGEIWKRRTIKINWAIIQYIIDNIPLQITQDEKDILPTEIPYSTSVTNKTDNFNGVISLDEPSLLNESIITPIDVNTKYKPLLLTKEALKNAYPSVPDRRWFTIIQVLKSRYNTLEMHLNDTRLLDILNEDEMNILDECISSQKTHFINDSELKA